VRSVAGIEWDAIDAGTLGEAVNDRAEMFRTLRSVNLQTAQSAYDWWMDQTAQRQQAANGPSPRSTGHHPDTGVDRAQLDLRRDLDGGLLSPLREFAM
jgi:hypothetical protein